jgi:hypothetical protein
MTQIKLLKLREMCLMDLNLLKTIQLGKAWEAVLGKVVQDFLMAN